MSHLFGIGTKPLRLTSVTANTTTTIPAGFAIVKIFVENTTANAITGGIKIGTTDGGVDVVVALPVVANALINVSDANLLKSLFSTSSDQTLYIQTVTLWNSASVNITFVLSKLLP